MTRTRALLTTLAALSVACSGSTGSSGGGGAVDAAAVDSGVGAVDSGAGAADSGAGAADSGAGSADSGASDTGVTDTGATDTGTADAGTQDSDNADSATSDSGNGDSGTPDAINPDTITQDAGTTDSGATDTNAGALTPATALKAGELLITEIMADSTAVSDDDGEWFEIVNTTTMDIDLRGLIIEDKNAKPHTVKADAAIVLKAGAYGVIGITTDKSKNGGYDGLYGYGKAIKLANGGGKIVLKADDKTVIDEVSYEDSDKGWPNILKGHSHQLASAATSTTVNDNGNNWCVSQDTYGAGDFGTPGKKNPACVPDADKDGIPDATDNCKASHNPAQDDQDKDGLGDSCDNCPKVANKDQKDGDGDGKGDACPAAVCGDGKKEDPEECDDGNTKDGDGCSKGCTLEAAKLKVGDLIISELHPDAKAVGDSDGEYFELYNATDKDIDLVGLTIQGKDPAKNVHKITSDKALLIKAKGYFVFIANDKDDKNGGIKGAYEFKNISLGNSGSTVTILAGTTVIDSVTYPGSGSKGWPKYKDGASMQLSADKLDAKKNDDGASWCPSSKEFTKGGDKGTPGAANEVCK